MYELKLISIHTIIPLITFLHKVVYTSPNSDLPIFLLLQIISYKKRKHNGDEDSLLVGGFRGHPPEHLPFYSQ